MIRNIYSKKMFIADLILVSVWALFFSRYCSPGLLWLIPIRIALCFEMQRKSPWTLISAIGFLLAYSCVDNFSRPFERMFFNFFCAIGESELMIEIFSEPFEWEMKAWIGAISSVWYIWLVILPLVTGISFRNVRQIKWTSKWIWIYIIPFFGLCLWTMIEEGAVGCILLGLVISFLPVVYWSIYDRKGRSPVQLLLENRNIGWYLLYVTLFLSAITIGLKDITSLKLIGLIVFPAAFYILLTISFRLGTILTRCCLALSVSGWLYWLTFDTGKASTIVLLSIAISLIIFAGVTIIVKTKSWKAPMIIMLVVPTVIIPCTLGLNPYVAIDADYTRMYVSNVSVRNGVYVIEKYYEAIDSGQPFVCSRKYGLRDRYGVILPIEYTELKTLDRWGRYIATNSPDRYGNLTSDQRYGVFDMRNRTFVVNPKTIDVWGLEKIDDNLFKLINSEGRYFATLYFPGEYRGTYYPNAHIEPHYADGEISVEEFIGRSQNPNLDVDNPYWKAMRKKNPHAYRLLVQLSELGNEESSPMNDLNYARAISEIIRNDPYYKDNVEKALSDMAHISETITDSGSQLDINTWTDYLRLIASIRTSLSYDAIMSAKQDNEWIKKEYTTWHNLMEAMAYYLDYLYSAEIYRALPEEKNNRVIAWLDFRRVALEKEMGIFSGKLTYTAPVTLADSIKREEDFNDFFCHYHSFTDPYYYHPMWNEIKAAFDAWSFTRDKIAEQLQPHVSLSYKEYTLRVINGMFSFIEGLDNPAFRPAL